MSPVKGNWYPPNSSASRLAELQLCGAQHGTWQLTRDNDPAIVTGTFSELVFSDRVGNIPRKITLSDGSVFETKENDIIDTILEQNFHRAKSSSILHKLESRWGWATTALVVTAVITFSFFKWGLPWGASKAADTIPISVTQRIGGGALDLMDKLVFEPSSLPEDKQKSLRSHFNALAGRLNETTDYNFNFHFRDLQGLPNAMALPSGDIVVTDALIELANNQQEIDAILFHEIGHVVHRHGLQQVVQSTFVSTVIAIFTGDVSGSSELLVAFPAFLLQNQYMRRHETDADEYAFEQMMAQNIDPKYFASIMKRLTDEMEPVRSEHSNSNSSTHHSDDRNNTQGKDVSAYFSTHPITDDRIQRAMEYSSRFADNSFKTDN